MSMERVWSPDGPFSWPTRTPRPTRCPITQQPSRELKEPCSNTSSRTTSHTMVVMPLEEPKRQRQGAG